MKGCGSCTLCCTLMAVEMAPRLEVDKPAGVKCNHLCKRGCGIYEERPQACRDFECLWLFSQARDDPEQRLPKMLRPDKTGVVLEVNTAQNIVAHCERPNSWTRGPINQFLRTMAGRTGVVIDHGGDSASVLEPDGRLTPLRYISTDEHSNERKYIRDLGQLAK